MTATATTKKTASKTPVKKKRSTAGKTTSRARAGADTRARGSSTTTTTKGKKTSTPKKTTTKKAQVQESTPREYTPEGFIEGGDSAIIASALTEGGLDRKDVNRIAEERIAASSGLVTRGGKEKYVPSMVSSILSRLLATGEYEVYSSWQLVPIEKPKKTRTRKTAK